MYKVFEIVSKTNLFSDQDFSTITKSVYRIMGIAMLFILAYNLILMIINPDDKKSTGQMTKMIKDIIISFVLIIILPTIFSYIYIFQSHILSDNLIGQLIIGSVGVDNGDCNYDNYDLFDEHLLNEIEGSTPKDYLSIMCEDYNKLSDNTKGAYTIPSTLFVAFFHPNDYGYGECAEYVEGCANDSCPTSSVDPELCTIYYYDMKRSIFLGDIKPFVADRTYYNKLIKDEGEFEFNYLLAFIAGLLALYMFVCYTLAIGVRVAKLGFLQILSPIAVMMRIIPKQKEKIFDKWLKNLVDAYLDVFIRLAIIYFCLFAISLVPGVIHNMMVNAEGNFLIWALAEVVLILGILKFALDAPALLKEFIGDTGRFSLKSPRKQLQENKLAMGGIGAIGALGAVTTKNIGDGFSNFVSAKGIENKAKVVGKSFINIPRHISQGFGAVRSGYNYGKEAKTTADMRDYVFGAAAEQMSKAHMFGEGGVIDSRRQADLSAINNFYSVKYDAFNSPAEKIKAEKLDKVAESLKKLEDILDKKSPVVAVDNKFEALRKQIENGSDFRFTGKDGVEYSREKMERENIGLEKIYKALEDQKKVERGTARGEAYKQHQHDLDVNAAAKAYKEEITKKLSEINEGIKITAGARGETPHFISGSNAIFDENMNLKVSYKDAREAGDVAGKYSEHIKQQIINKQQVGTDNKK